MSPIAVPSQFRAGGKSGKPTCRSRYPERGNALNRSKLAAVEREALVGDVEKKSAAGAQNEWITSPWASFPVIVYSRLRKSARSAPLKSTARIVSPSEPYPGVSSAPGGVERR